MRRLIVALALAAPLVPTAHAVPLSFTHQGRLLDTSGAPLDGAHTLTLSLYDTPAGGAARWSDAFSVELDDGYYVVTLGSGAPLDIADFDGAGLYLGLQLDATPELPARLPVSSVPYAVRADVATDVRGGVVDATEVQIAGATVIDADGKIPFDALIDVPTDSDTLLDLGCGAGAVPVFDGTDWQCGTELPTHDHDAAELTSGTIDPARLPVGTGAAEVAAGDHKHDVGDLTSGTIDPARLTFGTGSTDIAAGDHTHDAAGIVSGKIDPARLSFGSGSTEIAAGDHAHSAADVGALSTGGGTLTGGLVASAGVKIGDGGTTCNSTAAGQLRFAAAELYVCDGSGWVSLTDASRKVAWHAYNAGNSSFSSGARLAYTGTTTNVGGAYATNGIATVPYAGTYRLCTYTISPNGTAGSVYMDLYVNGSSVQGQGGRVYAWNRNTSGDHHSLGGCVLRALKAGDQVEWRSMSLSVYPSATYSYMNGERL